MGYPLRPPLFILRLLSEKSETLKWHNDLRAMETEVCAIVLIDFLAFSALLRVELSLLLWPAGKSSHP